MLQDSERAALVAEITDTVIYGLWLNPLPPMAWYTPKHAAAYLCMTVGGLATLRRDGQGPKYSRPTWRTVRYFRADLDKWLLAHPERRDPGHRRVPGDPTPGGES